MKDELTNTTAEVVQEAKIEPIAEAKSAEHDDFLAGVQGADPESFNVCISCD